MDIGMLKLTAAGLGCAAMSLPIVAQVSANLDNTTVENLATKGTPYVLAAVSVALVVALYKVFGLFLAKIEEREGDLKDTIAANTASNLKVSESLDRLTANCAEARRK